MHVTIACMKQLEYALLYLKLFENNAKKKKKIKLKIACSIFIFYQKKAFKKL